MASKVLTAVRSEWKYVKKNSELLVLFLPALVWMAVLSFVPMIGLVIAFKRYRYDLGVWGSEWVGFKNLEFFFTSRVCQLKVEMSYVLQSRDVLYRESRGLTPGQWHLNCHRGLWLDSLRPSRLSDAYLEHFAWPIALV